MRRTFMPYAAGLALAVTLAGCAAESAAPVPARTIPSPTSPTSSLPTSTPSSSPTTKPTAAPDFPEGVPAAARKRTKEGAKAFVAHVLDRVNVAWTTPDSAALDGLCHEAAGACTFWVDEAKTLASRGQRYEADPVSLTRLDLLNTYAGKQRLITHIRQERRDIVDARGATVKTDELKDAVFISTLSWTSTGWQLYGFDAVNG